jgi:hypothetical protein
MGGKDEVQTCSRDESCHSDAVHGISTLSTRQSDVGDENSTNTALGLNVIRPASGALSVGFRLMNWKSCGVSNVV